MRSIPRLAAAVGVVLAACSGGGDVTAPVVVVTPSLAVVAGDQQVGTVARELPAAVAVQVTDAKTLAPIPQMLVTWVVVAGGGSVFVGATLTDANGMTKQRWTLGTGAGQQQVLEARAVDSTGAPIVYARATATAVPDIAVSFSTDGPNLWDGTRYVQAVSVQPGVPFFMGVMYGDAYLNITTACADGGAPDRIAWTWEFPNVADTLTAVGPTVFSADGVGWQQFVYAGPGSTRLALSAAAACVPGSSTIQYIPVDAATK